MLLKWKEVSWTVEWWKIQFFVLGWNSKGTHNKLMTVQDFFFRKCRWGIYRVARWISIPNSSNSLCNVIYIHTRYCYGPCLQGQQHTSYGRKISVWQIDIARVFIDPLCCSNLHQWPHSLNAFRKSIYVLCSMLCHFSGTVLDRLYQNLCYVKKMDTPQNSSLF